MVIYLCVKELSKPGYKTCLISCREKNGKGKKDGGWGGLSGWEETGSDSVAILTNLALLYIADDDTRDDTRDDTPLPNLVV